MSDHYFNINGGRGMISIANGYKYEGFYFEYHNLLGPTKMNKDGEMSKRTGRKFYQIVSKWEKLSKPEKEKTRLYG